MTILLTHLLAVGLLKIDFYEAYKTTLSNVNLPALVYLFLEKSTFSCQSLPSHAKVYHHMLKSTFSCQRLPSHVKGYHHMSKSTFTRQSLPSDTRVYHHLSNSTIRWQVESTFTYESLPWQRFYIWTRFYTWQRFYRFYIWQRFYIFGNDFILAYARQILLSLGNCHCPSAKIFLQSLRSIFVYIIRAGAYSLGMNPNLQVRYATATLSPSVPGFRFLSLRDTALLLPADEFFRDLPLNASTVKPETRRRYGEAIDEFRESILPELVTLPELDSTLLAYTEALFSEDPRPGRRQQVVNTISGLVNRAPGISSLFNATRAALKGWGKNLIPKQATPISKRLLIGMTGRQIQDGSRMMAALFCVAWSGLMRGSEVIALKRWNIALPGDRRLERVTAGTCGILIECAKTGNNQLVLLRDPECIQALVAYIDISDARPEDRLFPISFSGLLRSIRMTIETLGIQGVTHFTTHSFRHGGAVDLFLQDNDAESISIAGRWESSRSLKRYLKNGRSQLMRIAFTEHGETQMEIAHRIQFHGLNTVDNYAVVITSLGS